MPNKLTAITEALTPYVAFICAASVFLLLGLFASSILPQQVALILAEVLGLLGVALLIRRQGTLSLAPEDASWPSFKASGLKHLGWLPLLLVWGAVLGICVNLVGAVVMEVVPGQKEVAAQYAKTLKSLLKPSSVWLAVLGAISASVVAPLTEEAFFRGTMLPLQRVRESASLAVWLNGLFFSLIHMNTLSFLPLVILGALLAWLTLHTRSVWPAVMVHAGLNLFNGVITPQLMKLSGKDALEPDLELPIGEVLTSLTIMSVVSLSLGFFVFKYALKPTLSEDD